MAEDVITRIQSITLSHFRGFKDTYTLDTDADLVLITGPNGYGKTSLLEAVTLVLTEWHGRQDPETVLLARCGECSEPTESRGRLYDGFSIKARVQTEQSERELSVEWPRSSRAELTVSGLPPSRLMDATKETGDAPGDADESAGEQQSAERDAGRELAARLCAFFQDRVEAQFDEAATGDTLRDVFEPLPRGADRVREDLAGAIEDLQVKINEPPPDWKGSSEEQLVHRLNHAFSSFRQHYVGLATAAEHWSAEDEIPESLDDDAAMDGFASQTLQAAGAFRERSGEALRLRFRNVVKDELERQIRRARDQAAGSTAEGDAWRRELESIESEVHTIGEEYPTLEQDLLVFSAEKTDQPDALTVFRVLSTNARRWSQVQRRAGEVAEVSRFARALEELGAVQEDQAAACAEAMEAWLGPRRAASARLADLEARAELLREDLKRYRASKDLQRLRELERGLYPALETLLDAWEQCHRFRAHQRARAAHEAAGVELSKTLKAAKWGADRFDERTQASPWLKEQLQELANAVLGRFTLVEGVLPVTLVDQARASSDDPYRTHRIYAVQTKDGRELAHLSTGQKAQVAISLLVSQNLAVSGFLNHQLILLDDMTTAYDLSNLTREAILWRQLAYGNNDPQQRRQVFISSHHEDMTNHLLDLLVPPGGREMRLLRFAGWSPCTGPEIESYEVVSTRGRDEQREGLTDLARDLEAF